MSFTAVGVARLSQNANQKVTPTQIIPAGSCILAISLMSDLTPWPTFPSPGWTAPTDTSGNTYTLIGTVGYSAAGRLVGLNVWACFNCIALNGFILYHDNISGIAQVLFDPFVTGISTGQKFSQDTTQFADIPGLILNGQNGGNTTLGLVASADAGDFFTQNPDSGAGNSGAYAIVSQVGDGPTRSWLGTAQLGTVGQSNGPLGPNFVSYVNSPIAHVRIALVFDTQQFPRVANLVCHSGFNDGSGHNVPIFQGWAAGVTVLMVVSGAYVAGGNGIISDSAGNVYTAIGGATCTNVVGLVVYMCRNANAMSAGGFFNFGVGVGSYATVAAAVFPGATVFTDYKPSLRNGFATSGVVTNGTGDHSADFPLTLALTEFDTLVVEAGAAISDAVLSSQVPGVENFTWGQNTLWFGLTRVRTSGSGFLSNAHYSGVGGHARVLLGLFSNYQFASATLRGTGAVGLGLTTWTRVAAAAIAGAGIVGGNINFLIHDHPPPLAGRGAILVNNLLVERHSNAAAFLFANGSGTAFASWVAAALATLAGNGALEVRLGFKIYEQFLRGEGFYARTDVRHSPVIALHETQWLGEGIVFADSKIEPGIRPFRLPEYYLDLYTSEHKDKPILDAMSRTLVVPITQVQSLISALPDEFDLDLAVGVQLDHVGEWVGRDRYLEVPVNSFYSYDIEGLGLDQGHWKGPFDPTEGMWRLDDETYRRLLRAIVQANTWDGSLAGSYRAWEQLQFNVLIQDTGHMAAMIALQGPIPTPLTLALFTSDILKMRAGGVKLIDYMVETVTDAPFFGYDVDNQNITGYDEGAYGRMIPPVFVRAPDFGFLVQRLHGEGFIALRFIQRHNVGALIGGRGFLTIPLHEVSKIANIAVTLVGTGAIATFRVAATTVIAGRGFMPTNSIGVKRGVATLAGGGAMHNDAGTDAFITGIGSCTAISNVQVNDTPELDGVGTLVVNARVISLATAELDGTGAATGTGSEGPIKGAIAFLAGAGSLYGDAGAGATIAGEGFFTADSGIA